MVERVLRLLTGSATTVGQSAVVVSGGVKSQAELSVRLGKLGPEFQGLLQFGNPLRPGGQLASAPSPKWLWGSAHCGRC